MEKKGRIFAIVINPDEYQALKKAAKARLFETVDSIQKRNKERVERDVMKDITAVVEDVRSKRYGHSR